MRTNPGEYNADTMPRRKILTLGEGFIHYSGSYPMVFQHSGAHDFDLGGGSRGRVFHYSGSYPVVFQHSAPVAALENARGSLLVYWILARDYVRYQLG